MRLTLFIATTLLCSFTFAQRLHPYKKPVVTSRTQRDNRSSSLTKNLHITSSQETEIGALKKRIEVQTKEPRNRIKEAELVERFGSIDMRRFASQMAVLTPKQRAALKVWMRAHPPKVGL